MSYIHNPVLLNTLGGIYIIYGTVLDLIIYYFTMCFAHINADCLIQLFGVLDNDM
jgi:hypothetical protein